ncbi:MAG: CPBP family intramembrane metalloprotease [candidate division Zixibacteria bacterium]|nr:CPBP family intramembrane metalloprotease [candidate division Zixibacteria bacterium]
MNLPIPRSLRVAGRVLVAILMGIFVLNSVAVVVMNSDRLPSALRSQPWSEGFLSHTIMWLISLILILVVSRGKLRSFGFCRGEKYKTAQIIIPGAVAGLALATVLHLFPEDSEAFQRDYSFVQTVIFVWLYASVSEEILTRGLIQGFLNPLVQYGFSIFGVRISLPVLTGALFFGLMHAALLTTGMALFPVISIVVFASVLGLIAGYQREQTGSLIPAIIVHALGNIGGYCIGLFIA